MRVGFAVILAALAVPAVAPAGTVFLLDGRGWGHGVGMSQWGAEGYARHGFGYRQILAHYYPQTTIEAGNPRPVRVLLSRGRDAVRIGSAAPFVVLDARGHKLHLPARSVVINRKFTLRHKKLRPPLRFQPGAQPLQVDFAAYRGDVVVKRKPAGLMVVNLLPLDRYLRGVVPWEVPKGWHEATYEAQAVAARSYTLATLKPGEDFDLYSDTRSQMYGGVSAERPADEPRHRRDCGRGAEVGRPDDRRLLFLDLGRADLVRPRRLAEGASGAVPRVGGGPVRLHLAASRLADHGAEREPDRCVVEDSRRA